LLEDFSIGRLGFWVVTGGEQAVGLLDGLLRFARSQLLDELADGPLRLRAMELSRQFAGTSNDFRTTWVSKVASLTSRMYSERVMPIANLL